MELTRNEMYRGLYIKQCEKCGKEFDKRFFVEEKFICEECFNE